MRIKTSTDIAKALELMLEDTDHYIGEAKRQQFNLEVALDMVLDNAEKQDVIDFLGGVVCYNIADLADYYSSVLQGIDSILASLKSH